MIDRPADVVSEPDTNPADGATWSADPTGSHAIDRELQRQLMGAALFANRARPQIGRFALAERLGAGASSVVYSAWDELLARWVAVKVFVADSSATGDRPTISRSTPCAPSCSTAPRSADRPAAAPRRFRRDPETIWRCAPTQPASGHQRSGLPITESEIIMNRYYGLLIAAALAPAGCTEPAGPDDQASVAQFSFIADLGVALGSPVTTGSTIGLSNDYAATCASSGAPDAAYTWTAPSSGTYTFTTAGSLFDLLLEVRAFNTGASLGCNDDSIGLQSSVSVALSGGQTVIVVVDGFSTSSGSYRLNINGSGGGSVPSSGLHLWLRADRGVTAPGGRVSQWLDQSGSGRNASMATASRQPVLVPNAIGGLPVVRFNGAQSMNLDVIAQPTAFSVFVVGKNNTADESFSMILGPGGSSPNNQLRWDDGSHALFVGTGNGLPQITLAIGDTRVYHELSAVYDGSTMTVYRDGGAIASSSFTTSGPWTLASVGSWYSTYFMQGDLAELIMYARPLSGAERVSVDSYLLGRYPIP